MFIGRESELGKLNGFYQSKKFEMVIVYGRRRVGKTKLLTEFIKDKNAIFFVAEENNDVLNKEKFSKIVLNHFNENINISFDQWNDIFKYVAQKKQSGRLILVIDELPYLALDNPSFMSMLQNAVDHHLIHSDILLVLCGSSISFMENEIVAHKSPLYGRKTGQMKILPLEYYHAKKLFNHYTNDEQFKVYSILGGIPHYLIQFNPDLSLDENIIRYCLTNTSLFYDEPKNLLHQELRTPTVYNSILEAIAGGSSKINEIATKIVETPSKTAKYIQSLLELEIVRKRFPVDQKESRKSIYSLGDPLFEFMYRFVYKNRSLVEQDLGAALYHQVIKEDINAYYGKGFETICMQYLIRENKQLKLEFLVEQFGSWWGNNPILKKQEEIDIVGLSNNAAIYCECKYKNEKIGLDIYNKLVERSMLIPKDNKYYYIFSKVGFTTALLELAKKSNQLKLITLDDMYR